MNEARVLNRGLIFFHIQDLVQPALEPGLRQEIRPKKGRQDFLGQIHADYPGPQAHYVDVVVFHALAAGVSVMAQTGANPDDFVSGDAGTDSAAADDDATVGFTILDRQGHR